MDFAKKQKNTFVSLAHHALGVFCVRWQTEYVTS